jgi:hypothetical protein
MTAFHHTVGDVGAPADVGAERAFLAWRVLATAALLGVMTDALVRGGPPGVGFAVSVLTFLASLLSLTWRARGAMPREGRWLLAACLAFAASFVVRDSPELGALNILGIVAALVLLGAALRSADGRFLGEARVRDVVWACVSVGAETAFGAVPLVLSDVALGQVVDARRLPSAIALVRGFALAAPLVLIFGALLMVADPVYGRLVGDLVRIDTELLLSHVVLAGFVAWIVGGYLRGSLVAARPMLAEPRGPAGMLGRLEIGLTLGALNALFLSFVLVQFRYFFGGADLVQQTAGLGYAEYARRGFFELVVVSLLVLPVLLAGNALRRADDPRTERLFRRLAASLVALLFVIMYSALGRMRLYTQEYGLTSDRLYATVFMAWLALTFVWFLVTVLGGRPRRFVVGAVASALAGLAVLDAVGPESIIARFNTGRAVEAARSGRGYRLDAEYLARLGGDAVPAVVGALLSPELTRLAMATPAGDERRRILDDRMRRGGAAARPLAARRPARLAQLEPRACARRARGGGEREPAPQGDLRVGGHRGAARVALAFSTGGAADDATDAIARRPG